MLKRKIEQHLNDWKSKPGHKPLIIKGCRQCGKTCSVLDFAKKNYAHVVYLNFFENPDYASVFSGSLEIDYLIMMLSTLLGDAAVFEAGKTVLVLDEIQDCPQILSYGRPVRCHRHRFPAGSPGLRKRTQIHSGKL